MVRKNLLQGLNVFIKVLSFLYQEFTELLSEFLCSLSIFAFVLINQNFIFFNCFYNLKSAQNHTNFLVGL